MKTRHALLTPAERTRFRRFLAACEQRLAAERRHLDALDARLKAAITIEAEDVPPSIATMHAQVRLRDQQSGKTQVRTVMLPSDAEVLAARRAVSSWLEPQILGAREGEEIHLGAGEARRVFRVEKVLHQIEAADRELRFQRRRSRAKRQSRPNRIVAAPVRNPISGVAN